MAKQYSYDEILKVKHAFLTDGEKSYYLELLKNPKHRNIHFLLRDLDSQLLFKKAMELIDLAELGAFNQQEMAVAEYKILHYLAAIREADEMKQELYILPIDTKKTKHRGRDKADYSVYEQLQKQSLEKLKTIEALIEISRKNDEEERKKQECLAKENQEEMQC